MSPNELARELGISPKTLRAWLRERYPHPAQLKGSAWQLTANQVEAARARFTDEAAPRRGRTTRLTERPKGKRTERSRSDSDEAYVINLCDTLLGETALRQHCFAWLVGDPGKSGQRRPLPVDAYYPDHRLVVEYRERQHDEPVAFFDRRDTVSGVPRGGQRRIYDERRDREIPNHGLRLVIVRPGDLTANSRGRLLRRCDADVVSLARVVGVPGVA
jgi:MerR HTH family regulatory protein